MIAIWAVSTTQTDHGCQQSFFIKCGTVATGVEQGQAHRPEAPIAVGSCVEDRPTRPGRLWTNTFEQTV